MVERDLPKVDVIGSIPVTRSNVSTDRECSPIHCRTTFAAERTSHAFKSQHSRDRDASVVLMWGQFLKGDDRTKLNDLKVFQSRRCLSSPVRINEAHVSLKVPITEIYLHRGRFDPLDNAEAPDFSFAS